MKANEVGASHRDSNNPYFKVSKKQSNGPFFGFGN